MKFLVMISVLVLVLVVILTAAYQRADRETMTAEDFRLGAGYQTANLSDGVTAYKLAGADGGPWVIIVHGATLGSMAYQAYVPPLVAAGYRVVIYDQYGRGFSDRPAARFTIDLMRRQLLELMDDLQIEKAHLFGISLGGAVIARFAAEHGDRVTSMAYQVPLIAGATVSPALVLSRLPLIGPMLARFYAIPAIIARGESFGTDTQGARDVVAHFKQQFLVHGTERMMRQMLTGDALSDRMADHQKIAASGMAAQFVYATDDTEIAAAQVEQALSHYDNPEVHQYTGGHFFSSGRAEELSAKLDGFFKAQAPR